MSHPYPESYKAPPLPYSFLKRRLHSLTGMLLILFLIEHLLSNSQAALWLGEDGEGFIRAANFLHSLPYIQVLEWALLGIPFLLHSYWGIRSLFTVRFNSFRGDSSSVSLPSYSRNQAFTWQRLSALFLICALLYHVLEMRFWGYPLDLPGVGQRNYAVLIDLDVGAYTVASRLQATVLDQKDYARLIQGKEVIALRKVRALAQEKNILRRSNIPIPVRILQEEQEIETTKRWVASMKKKAVQKGQALVIAANFGTALLFVVRDTFKSVWVAIFYTLFVISAVFHACNGLWTYCIVWGITLTEKSRTFMRRFSMFLMACLMFLGLAAIWGTFWINLRQ